MSLLHFLVLSHVLDPSVTIPEVLAMLRCTSEADERSAEEEADTGRGDEAEARVRPFEVPSDYWV